MKVIKRIASEYFFRTKQTMPANEVPNKIKIRYPIKKTFTFKKHSKSEQIICHPCAKREHGPKNKTPLQDMFK